MLYCRLCPGHCCYRQPGAMLLVTAEDINRLARHFGISDGEARQRYMENRFTLRVGPDRACIFLEADRAACRCTVYPARPLQCQPFPFGRPCPYLATERLPLALLPPAGAATLRTAWTAARLLARLWRATAAAPLPGERLGKDGPDLEVEEPVR